MAACLNACNSPEPGATGRRAHVIATTKPMTPRQERVIRTLVDTGEWTSREAIDRIAGASNGPEVIRQLRQRFGYDSIEMERITVMDSDGLLTQPGRYRLTDTGRQRLAENAVK